jgi:putative SOS response-associated peptidase YedK
LSLRPVFARASWGFTPAWSKERIPPASRRPPINARCETITQNGMFKDAYRYRRALMPIDGYFEWHDIFANLKNKQPYAIAMKNHSPFALAAIWEDWRDRTTVEIVKTFAVVTCEPNVMMRRIHDRMPVILQRKDYERWFSDEPDPRDLMKPFDSELMKMWPISRQVGKQQHS